MGHNTGTFSCLEASEANREQTEDMLDYLGFYPFSHLYSKEFGGKIPPCVDGQFNVPEVFDSHQPTPG